MTKSIIWNKLKALGYESKKLKAVYEVSYQQASLSLLENILEQLQGEGVNESLGEVDGGSLQPTLINDSSNDSESIWNYKIIQSSWHPDSYHMWMYEGKKDYWYFRTDNMATEIKLQDLETKVSKLNSLASTKSVVTQSCGTWSNIFTCNDMELEKLLNSQYYQLNRDNIMQRSLVVAEIHTQAVKQQQLLKEWQLEQNSIVATVTDDNTYYVLVHSQADEVYITTPYCLNAKRLIDCKDKELKESLYASKEVAADEAQEWLKDSYQVVEVDYNNIRLDIKAYFRDRVLVEQINCYLPKDEASAKGYYYKGLPVEHFSNYTEMYHEVIYPVLDYTSTNTVSLLTNFQSDKWIYCNGVKVSSSEEAVVLAKNYLSTGVKQQQVPSSEQAIQPFDYALELTKLKSLSRQEFMALIQEVRHTIPLSSSYIPKSVVIKNYMTNAEYKVATHLDRNLDNDFELDNDFAVDCWQRLMNIQDCFTEAGNYHESQRQQIIEENVNYRKQRQAIKRKLNRLECKSIYGYRGI